MQPNRKKLWPEFDNSMMFSKHYTDSKTDHNNWDLLTTRYNLIKNREQRKQIIPKILHQVWLGKPMPAAIAARCKSVVDSLPSDWTYKLWTDNDIKTLKNFSQIDNFYKSPSVGQKSDIVRNHILHEFGGVYCDTDFVIVNFFEELLDLDFFGGIVYDSVPNIANSVMGSSPKNSYIADIQILDAPLSFASPMHVINSTGQGLITRKFFKHLKTNDNILALPNSFLYPFPNFSICKTLGNDYKLYLKPETLCCHLWDCSWM